MGHTKIEGKSLSTGQLIINVDVKQHDLFKVEGFNILSEEKVRLVDCLLGSRIKVNTINGDHFLKLNQLTEHN